MGFLEWNGCRVFMEWRGDERLFFCLCGYTMKGFVGNNARTLLLFLPSFTCFGILKLWYGDSCLLCESKVAYRNARVFAYRHDEGFVSGRVGMPSPQPCPQT